MLRIAIVGAGPAGASAGCHLARLGHRVRLIDRADFPRDKVCGDWLPPDAVGELAQVGVDATALVAQSGVALAIRHGALSAPSGRTSRAPLARSAWCVRRRHLDAALYAHAVQAGCAPLRADLRTLARDAEPLLRDADVIVDARGAHAAAANAIGLRCYWTVPRAAVDAEALDTVRLITDPRFARGYAWIFPVEADAKEVRFNVGVGLLRRDSGRGHSVADFLGHITHADPALRALAERATLRTRPVGHHVGLGLWRVPADGEDVVRIGDAGNLADPLTGDGVPNALRSGRLAAEAIAHAVDAADAARRWRACRDTAFAPELRLALVLRRLLSGTLAKEAAGALVAGNAWLRVRLHGALFGDVPYRSLLGAAPRDGAPGLAAARDG